MFTAAAATPPAAYPELLWLDVVLNEQPLGAALATLPAPGKGVWLESSTLQGWIGDSVGARLTTTIDGTSYTALDPLPGVRYYIDKPTQTLHLKLPAELFPVQIRGRHARSRAVRADRGRGGVLNYAISGSTTNTESAGSAQSGAALFDAFLFGRFGSFRQSWLMNPAVGFEGVRLDSRWITDFPRQTLRVTLGDGITPADPFDQRIRFGGVQIRRAFETRPTEPVFPVPIFTGLAELPSTVDLYVDNVRRAQFELDPGPYEITNPPIVTGAGTAQLVLTDVLGNTQVMALPFFVDASLLRTGLSDFNVSLGYVREGFASTDSEYTKPIGAGELRHGVSDALTAEARGRWTDVFRSGSLGLSWQPEPHTPLLLSLSAGGYRDSDSRHGSLVQLQASLRPRNWRFAFQSTVADPGTSRPAQNLPFRYRHLMQAGARRGRWSADLTGLTRELGDGSRFSSLALRVGFTPRRLFAGVVSGELFHTVDHNQDIADHGIRLFISWSPRLTTTASASTGTGRTPFQALQINERTLDEIGANYDVGLTRTDRNSRGYALATVRLSQAELDGRVESLSGGREVLALGARGAIGWLGGHLFSGRQLHGSFALVDLGGQAGLPVYRENRLSGTSNDRGLVMIPDLLEYQANQISIDPAQLPLNVHPGESRIAVTPGHLTGLVVDFELRRVRQATLRLRTAGGLAVPAGAQLTVNGELERQPVGDEGLAYLETLAIGENQVIAEWSRGRCVLSVYYPDSPDDPLPDLGIRHCTPL